MVKAIQEHDKYHQIVKKSSHLEMCSNQPVSYKPYRTNGQSDSTTLRNYPESQPEEVNYLGNKGRNPYSNIFISSRKDRPNLK